MAVTADSVVVEVMAKLDKFQADVRAAADTFERGMAGVERAATTAEKTVSGSSNAMAATVANGGDRMTRVFTKVVNNYTTIVHAAQQADKVVRETANSSAQAVTKIGQTTDQSLAQQRAAYQQLGFQLSDVVAQASNGTSAFVILAQQGGQTAAALSGFGGVVGRVATFMSGPFGAAILGAVTVLGLLATKEDEVEKATRKHGEAARTLQEAIEDLDKATGRSLKTHDEEVKAAVSAARAKLNEAIATRELTKAVLENALAEQEARKIRAQGYGTRGEAVPLGIAAGDQIIGALRNQLAQQNAEIAQAQASLRGATADAIIGDIESRFDPAVAAVRRYENALSALRKEFEAGRISRAKFDAEAEKLARTRDAGINAAREEARSRREAAREEREAAREAAKAEREYWAIVKAGNGAIDDATRMIEERQRRMEAVTERAAELLGEINNQLGVRSLDQIVAGIDRRTDDALDQRRSEPGRQFLGDLRAEDINDELDRVKIGGLQSLEDGLTDVISGTRSVADAFKDMADQIIADLTRIAVRQMIVQPLAGALFGGGNPLATILPGRASGGHVQAGRLYKINESGPEVFQPAQSGKIYPTGSLRAAAGGGGATVINRFSLDMRGAITTPALVQQLNATVAAAERRAVTTAVGISAKGAPGRLQSFQALGT